MYNGQVTVPTWEVLLLVKWPRVSLFLSLFACWVLQLGWQE